MTTGFFTHDLCLCPDTGEGNPDHPDRIERINWLMQASALSKRVLHLEAEKARMCDILLAHAEPYIQKLQALAKEHAKVSAETSITPQLLEGAMKSAGAAIEATKQVVLGHLKNAFVCVRPPGHHAGIDFGGGFCLINSVACAARFASERLGLKRIAVIDVDAHRANGSEDILASNPTFMLFDSFQASAYPYGLEMCQADNVVNAALEDGTLGRDVIHLIETQWIPKLRAFSPELILVSFGFDTHCEDDQTLLKFSEFDYSYLTRCLMRVAHDVCSDRLVSVMEGGYNKSALARSVLAHVGTLAE